jgi:hypothetical protein
MKIISYLLILQFLFYTPYGTSQVETQKVKQIPFALVKMLKHELTVNSDHYFTDDELSFKAAQIDKKVTNEVVSEIVKQLKDSSFSFESIKANINQGLIQEEQNKLIEIKYLLSLAPSQKLDDFFHEALKYGMYSNEYKFLYQSAYNQLEKIEVLMQMINQDFSLIRSQNAKQLGMMNREQLIKHFESTDELMHYKNNKVLTAVIIVLTVAAAGFITWGVISATKARHERKKSELNADYDQRERDAYAQHLKDIKTLEEFFAERERLREEGYVWQICSVTTTPKTSSCSYDFRSYSGDEVCTTRCLKNATGHELMHAKNCSSGFIPSNCFNKNPAVAGYDDGYAVGWNNGYDVAYTRAYNDAYSSAYNNAYSYAYSRGYDRGYNAGFNAGWSDGYYDYSNKKMGLVEEDDNALGYQKGFSEGYSYALQLKTGF